MRDTKHSHDDISKMLGILSWCYTGWKLILWRTATASGEVKGIADCQVREMVIDFSSVNGFSSIRLLHLFWSDALVIEDCVVADMKSVRLACDAAEEGRATRARRTQNTKHLSSFNKAIKITEDVDALALITKDLPHKTCGVEEDVSQGILEVGRLTEAKDIEILEGDAGGSRSIAISSCGAGL
jgi:hypothetical protein